MSTESAQAEGERARRIVLERRAEIADLVEQLLDRDTLSAGEIMDYSPNNRGVAA